MKTLHLNLKKKWFDMILSGEKTEEYREIKNSIVSLLFDWRRIGNTRDYLKDTLLSDEESTECWCVLKDFDTITFSNGMTPPVPRFEIEFDHIRIDYGIPKFGATPNKKYFVLGLGRVLNKQNC